VLGIGYRDHKDFFALKILSGELKPDVMQMRHAHNDYFGALQSKGIPGLILQLLIYAVPLLIFIRGLHEARGEQLFAALGGTLMTTAYMTYSLTEVPMHNGLPLIFFIVTTSLLIGILKQPQDTIDKDYSR
jgi:O-antigen ligase